MSLRNMPCGSDPLFSPAQKHIGVRQKKAVAFGLKLGHDTWKTPHFIFIKSIVSAETSFAAPSGSPLKRMGASAAPAAASVALVAVSTILFLQILVCDVQNGISGAL